MTVAKGREKRREDRIAAVLPVRLNNAVGVTRDVSVTGIFFETDALLTPGSSIDFVVDIDTLRGKGILKCQGNIVRTEACDKRLGVAVKILKSRMKVGFSN
jgi:hypothetical protein